MAAALQDALAGGADPHALLVAVHVRGLPEPDPLVRAAVVALGCPRARVGWVAAELGVSARHSITTEHLLLERNQLLDGRVISLEYRTRMG